MNIVFVLALLLLNLGPLSGLKPSREKPKQRPSVVQVVAIRYCLDDKPISELSVPGVGQAEVTLKMQPGASVQLDVRLVDQQQPPQKDKGQPTLKYGFGRTDKTATLKDGRWIVTVPFDGSVKPESLLIALKNRKVRTIVTVGGTIKKLQDEVVWTFRLDGADLGPDTRDAFKEASKDK